MKVNITGKGVIPMIGLLAPVYNHELSERAILKLLNFKSFRVFDSVSGMIITKNNYQKMVENKITEKTVKPVAEPVEETIVEVTQVTTTDERNQTLKSANKWHGERNHPNPSIKGQEVTEEYITETAVKLVLTEDTTVDEVVDITDDDIIETEEDYNAMDVVDEVTEDTETVSDETTTEETKKPNYENRNKNKNRNKKH